MTGNSLKLASGGEMSAEYLTHARKYFVNEQNEQAFIDYCGRPLRKSIRFNSLKTDRESFLKIAEKYNWILTPIPWCTEGFWVDLDKANHEASLGNLPEHIQGLFYIQEASSMLPPFALLSQAEFEEPLVADFAAAPGSKTTQLSAMLNNRGIVLANELSASRLKGLHANLVRCGILNVCMSHQDGRKIGELMPQQFDFILLDAPCGGEGTVRKDFDALKSWDLEKVNALASLQKDLIISAYKALKPGGRLVYSTCTLSPQENQEVAKYLLEHTNAEVNPLNNLFKDAEKARTEEGYLLVLPHLFDSEGFFVASFNKPLSDENQDSPKPVFTSPFKPLTKKIKQQLVEHFKKYYDVDILPEGYQLLQREKEIWIFPKCISDINRFMKINRAGLKVATLFPNKTKGTFELACCFGDGAGKQLVDLNREQAMQYYQGLNVELDDLQRQKYELCDGEVLLKYQGSSLGLGLNKNGKIKNSLPRELVRDNICFP